MDSVITKSNDNVFEISWAHFFSSFESLPNFLFIKNQKSNDPESSTSFVSLPWTQMSSRLLLQHEHLKTLESGKFTLNLKMTTKNLTSSAHHDVHFHSKGSEVSSCKSLLHWFAHIVDLIGCSRLIFFINHLDSLSNSSINSKFVKEKCLHFESFTRFFSIRRLVRRIVGATKTAVTKANKVSNWK